ncbi:hypothetical protein P280DRAFT_103771 [Massarina eburnea CBS 473.64]|uniref:Uncharacterized protein n=1 Tax=Massarina eburnea CBS 473.64 TaxID=1395130 RepID=A0A6A6RTA3_9PLEO|nr:hypothetical protein P280DRAFT_103771 [Massarina eburnea CBS 473.64]
MNQGKSEPSLAIPCYSLPFPPPKTLALSPLPLSLPEQHRHIPSPARSPQPAVRCTLHSAHFFPPRPSTTLHHQRPSPHSSANSTFLRVPSI